MFRHGRLDSVWLLKPTLTIDVKNSENKAH